MKRKFSPREQIVLLAVPIALVILFPYADEALGTSFTEKATITAHYFSKAHSVWTGKMMIQQNAAWVIQVANNNGSGSLPVTPQQYNHLVDGEPVRIQGKRGRFTGRWYLSNYNLLPAGT